MLLLHHGSCGVRGSGVRSTMEQVHNQWSAVDSPLGTKPHTKHSGASGDPSLPPCCVCVCVCVCLCVFFQLLDGLDVLLRNTLTPLQQRFMAQSLTGTFQNLTADQLRRSECVLCVVFVETLIHFLQSVINGLCCAHISPNDCD